jgi:murein DD-endopeptidase MepM/ murein hydrolase activator NlpD
VDTPSLPVSWPPKPAATDPSAGAGPASKPSQADRARVLQLTQEFEAHFIVQMIRQMRTSMVDDQPDEGLGAGTMTDTMDIELARQLSKTGGIGLTAYLRDAIERQALGAGANTDPLSAAVNSLTPMAAPGSPAAAPVVAPMVTPAESHDEEPAAVPLPLPAAISSPFGYRPDPFTGATRFHAGVDIAAAYGREVPSAGAGRVVFSGSQGGYGNTVVVQHEGGVRTRYAHLSSIQVEVGARVGAGTVIGRVGSSGRSTGPHLHFEVLQDGQPVNPAVAATRFAGLLKIEGVVADLPISQPSTLGVAVGVDDEDSGQ